MKFHINDKGVVGQCRAGEGGGCPFGGVDEHYGSIKEARVGYETRMKNNEFNTVSRGSSEKPSTPSVEEEFQGIHTLGEAPNRVTALYGGTEENDGEDAVFVDSNGRIESIQYVSLSTLNKLVKDTDNAEIMEEALKRGSSRTLKNLAGNPNASDYILTEIYDSTSDEKLRQALVKNNNFPIGSMSGKDLVHLIESTNNSMRRNEIYKSNEINDDHLEAISNMDRTYGFSGLQTVLRNPDNQVSVEKLVEVSEKGGSAYDVGYAQFSGRYPADRVAGLDNKLVYWGNVGRVDAKYLDGYAKWAAANSESSDSIIKMNVESIGRSIAGREDVPISALSTLASRGIALKSIYDNPNSDEKLKSYIASKDENVAKLKKIDDKIGEMSRQEFIGSVSSYDGDTTRGSSRTFNTTVRKFDVDKMKAYGFGKDEVMILMNKERFNGGVSYDEETGVFKGSVDSSG